MLKLTISCCTDTHIAIMHVAIVKPGARSRRPRAWFLETKCIFSRSPVAGPMAK